MQSYLYFSDILLQGIQKIQTLINAFINYPNADSYLLLAFGEDSNIRLAKVQLEMWLADASNLPKIEIVRSAEIGGSSGAYAAKTDTIYLSEELLLGNVNNIDGVAKVLLEELGHALDVRINQKDAPGDEGAIFALLATGTVPDEKTLAGLKNENDTAKVVLKSQVIELEQVSPDPGSTTTTAFNVGTFEGSRTFNDFVGSSDRIDFYRINLTENTFVEFSFTPLNAFSNFQFGQDLNQNGLLESNEVYEELNRSANDSGVFGAALEKGTYFARISPYYSDGNTDYTFTISQTQRKGLAVDPGNTATTALDVGSFEGNRTYFDYVGLTDSNDFYRLPLQNNSRFNLSFTPQNNYLNIVLGQDKNQNGIIESTEVLDDFGRSANSPGAEEYILEKGNYFIRVYPYYSGIDGSSNYSVTFSVTPQPTLPTDPGNTTNQALNIGTLFGSRTYRDYVGVTDGQDYYRFTLNGRKKVNLSFTAENDYLNFALGSDTNQSGILESNEFLTSFGTSSSAVREVTLEAGTYFAVVYPYYSGVNGSSQYSLTLSVPGNSTADFNNDGKTDILLNNPTQGWNSAWLMDGTNYAGYASVFGSAGYKPVATADFNKDGKTDLVVNNPSNNFNAVWFMDGGNYVSGVGLPTAAGWQIKGAADFNGDGNTDILLNNTSTNWNTVWFLGGANGASYTGFGNLPVANGWNITGVADFNGDGNSDILLNNPSQGWNSVWFLNGTTYSGYANLPSAQGWQSLGTGDFNGDGKPDIILNNLNSNWNTVWLMNGTNYAGFANLPTAPAGWQISGMA